MALSFKTIYRREPTTVQKTKHSTVFVLISCDQNTTELIVEELKTISTVRKTERVEGIYNILVIMKSNSIEKIKQSIAHKIRIIEGIRSCLTLFEIDSSNLEMEVT